MKKIAAVLFVCLLACLSVTAEQTFYETAKKGDAKEVYGLGGAANLVVACAEGDTDTVRLLLQKGVSPNIAAQASTPLRTAAMYGHADIVRLLLEKGALPDYKAEGSPWTPLLAAVASGYADTVDILLKAGADPNYAYYTEEGFLVTPVLMAGIYGHTDILRMLLQKGGKANMIVDRTHNKSLIDFVRNSNSKNREAVIELLKEYGGR